VAGLPVAVPTAVPLTEELLQVSVAFGATSVVVPAVAAMAPLGDTVQVPGVNGAAEATPVPSAVAATAAATATIVRTRGLRIVLLPKELICEGPASELRTFPRRVLGNPPSDRFLACYQLVGYWPVMFGNKDYPRIRENLPNLRCALSTWSQE